MTVCCFGRENDHRHRGERECFCERHREREIQSTSSFSNIPSQSVARRLSRREGPSTPAPRPPSQKDVARSRGGGISFLDAGRRRRRQALKSTFARIGFSKIFSPLLIFHRMFASLRCLHFSFMHVFFSPPSPPPEDAGGKAARLE